MSSEISHHPINFKVESNNKNKKHNEKVKKLSENETDSANKEFF